MATAAQRRKADKAAAEAKPSYNIDLLRLIVAATIANSFIYTKGEDNAPMMVAGLVEVNNTLKNDAGEVATRATEAGVKYVESLPAVEVGDKNPGGEGSGASPAWANGQNEIKPESDNSTMNQTENSGTVSGLAAALISSAVKSAFTIDADIPPPSGSSRRVGGEKYPFDALQAGQSFFVPASADNPNPAKSLASTVSSATARYAVQVGTETEQITRSTYEVDAAGKRVKKDGSYVKTGEETVTVPKMVNTRVFLVRPVDETAQGRGKGARVWRTA